VSGAALDAERRAVLDAVLERLLPGDEHGPGALELGAGEYVVRALDAEHRGDRDAYERGLDAFDEGARARGADGFAALEVGARDELLTQAERDGDPFFELVRRHAIEGCFGDPRWGGNIGGAGWELLGYPGPRTAWSEREQQLDELPEPR
jgi:Gluconate 2-dehydrogenase subunit 3